MLTDGGKKACSHPFRKHWSVFRYSRFQRHSSWFIDTWMWHRLVVRWDLNCPKNEFRHFAAASVEVTCQTGRSRSTTKAFPDARSLLHVRLAHCSAQIGCRGQIDPTCLLWGRGGHRYQAPQESECKIEGRGRGVKTESMCDNMHFTSE